MILLIELAAMQSAFFWSLLMVIKGNNYSSLRGWVFMAIAKRV
jgi:hypothetical protein